MEGCQVEIFSSLDAGRGVQEKNYSLPIYAGKPLKKSFQLSIYAGVSRKNIIPSRCIQGSL